MKTKKNKTEEEKKEEKAVTELISQSH